MVPEFDSELSLLPDVISEENAALAQESLSNSQYDETDAGAVENPISVNNAENFQDTDHDTQVLNNNTGSDTSLNYISELPPDQNYSNTNHIGQKPSLLLDHLSNCAEAEKVMIDDINDEDDDEEETIEERIYALTEMLPDRMVQFASRSLNLTSNVASTAFAVTRKVLWIVSTSFSILILPVLFENEMNAISEQYSNEVRTMMLGPAAAAISSGNSIPHSVITNSLTK